MSPQTNSNSIKFSVSRARKVIKFVATLYRAIGLTLPRFQKRLIAKLYGNVNASGYRRYRRCYYSTPRKNAKSTLAAALCLYHLFADGEDNPRVYLAATTLEQTRETFEIISRMIAAVPVLDANTRVIDSQNRREITRLKDGHKIGYIAALTSRGSKQGKNPSAVVMDELCDWTEVHRQLWNDMTQGGQFARKQPLLILTTTAGTTISTIAKEQYEYAHKILDGTVQDEQFLPFIIEADPAKWSDHAEQVRVNPLVVEGFIPEESIRAEFLQAQASPSDLHVFQNKRLNLWIASTVAYLDMPKWNAQTATVPDADLVGLPCVAGLDLSRRDDLTALVLLFDQTQPDGTHRYISRSFFWIPEEGIEQRQRADGQPYADWITDHHIYLSEGATVDHHLILDKLKELSATYRIREVSFDEWSADYLAVDLERAGFRISPHRQGYKSMSAPLKELQTVILNGLLVHGNHPVLTWNAANFNVKPDEAGNVKPSKRDRKSKIDGIVALTMALSTLMRHQQRPQRSTTALERILAARTQDEAA